MKNVSDKRFELDAHQHPDGILVFFCPLCGHRVNLRPESRRTCRWCGVVWHYVREVGQRVVIERGAS